jgi:hypothetical protein
VLLEKPPFSLASLSVDDIQVCEGARMAAKGGKASDSRDILAPTPSHNVAFLPLGAASRRGSGCE